MSSDYFSLSLETPSGVVLPSIEYDSQRWFVGEPGQEFVVAVTMINNSQKTYRVSLTVDGHQPGYHLIFYGHQANYRSVFQGWLQQTGAVSGPCSTTYRLFKFGSCKPSQAAPTVDNVDDIQAGRIEVILEEVVNSGLHQALNVKAAYPTGAAADKKLPEGKKWFLAPGLKAEAGSMKASTTSWSTCIFNTVCRLPSLRARFDSSEALFLRKALNPRFASHRAILRQSINPTISVLGAEPVTNNAAPDEATSRPKAPGAAAGAAAAAASGLKREGAGVKRERDDAEGDDDDEPAVPRSATAAERVDLTEEPVQPMMVGGRQVAADELAICDLCDSDDEGAAPKWQVKKKQQINVEL